MDIFRYTDKRVVVAGGGGSGIGAAAVALLLELGAKPYVLDLQPPRDPRVDFIRTDFRVRQQIGAAADRIGAPVGSPRGFVRMARSAGG